jgi:hypothetical protein
MALQLLRPRATLPFTAASVLRMSPDATFGKFPHGSADQGALSDLLQPSRAFLRRDCRGGDHQTHQSGIVELHHRPL